METISIIFNFILPLEHKPLILQRINMEETYQQRQGQTQIPPIYNWEVHRGKLESDSSFKEISLSMNQDNPHGQLSLPTNNRPDSPSNPLTKNLSPTKNSNSEIKVVTCQCADCQYMKDKPSVEYGPTMQDYLDMLPLSLKNNLDLH